MILLKKPTVFITRKIPEQIIEPFKDQLNFKMWDHEEIPIPKHHLINQIKACDGLLSVVSDEIDEEVIRAGSHLKIIANFAVGYDNIDVRLANNQNIIVTNTPDVLTESTADLGFGLLMATARRIVEGSEYIKQDKWKSWAPFMLAGSDIFSKKIGIVGMGRIGKAIAKRAKGFDMSIFYHNRSRDKDTEQLLDATYLTLDELLQEVDFVVSVVPLTKETKNLFDAEKFKLMKESAIFINISRGQVVDEQALYHALKNKEITAAGLDVFEKEPIESTHPLVHLPNAVCTPHIGSASVETRKQMLALCLENISLVMNEEAPKTPVKV